tara:strand:+ start:168 stop:428 length:261 start_codon:yes stop_codon:yes gene_type:complete
MADKKSEKEILQSFQHKVDKYIYGDNLSNIKDGTPFISVKTSTSGKILVMVGDELGYSTSKILTNKEAFKTAFELLQLIYKQSSKK